MARSAQLRGLPLKRDRQQMPAQLAACSSAMCDGDVMAPRCLSPHPGPWITLMAPRCLAAWREVNAGERRPTSSAGHMYVLTILPCCTLATKTPPIVAFILLVVVFFAFCVIPTFGVHDRPNGHSGAPTTRHIHRPSSLCDTNVQGPRQAVPDHSGALTTRHIHKIEGRGEELNVWL